MTAQGKVNADVFNAQEGEKVDPAKVKLDAADSEAILKFIVHLEKTLPIKG